MKSRSRSTPVPTPWTTATVRSPSALACSPEPFVAGTITSVTVTITDDDEAPSAPTGFTGELRHENVILSWTPGNAGQVDGAASTITGYQWRASPDNGQNWDPDWTEISGSGADTTSFTINAAGLHHASYRFQVRAVSDAGEGFPASANVQIPPLVTNLSTTGYTSSVQVDSTTRVAQPFTTGSHAPGYVLNAVELNLDSAPTSPSEISVALYSATNGVPGSPLHTFIKPSSITSGANVFTAGQRLPVQSNTTYFVVITYSGTGSFGVNQARSTSETGRAGFSIGDVHFTGNPWAAATDLLALRVAGLDIEPTPRPPEKLRALAGDANIKLVWDTNPRSSRPTLHQYRQSTDSGATWNPDWTDVPSSASGDANANSYTLTNLSNDTAYTFQVRAGTGQLRSEPSNTASATPRDATDVWTSTSPRSFTYHGNTYDIVALQPLYGGLLLQLRFRESKEIMDRQAQLVTSTAHFQEMLDSMVLHVGDDQFPFTERDGTNFETSGPHTTGIRLYWRNAGIDSLDGKTLKLTIGTGRAEDTDAPTLSQAFVQDGRNLMELQFSEELDQTSIPQPGAFSVAVNGVAFGVNGVSAPGGDRYKSEIVLTLDQVISQGDSVTVAYKPPSVDALRDISNNRVAAFSGFFAEHWLVRHHVIRSGPVISVANALAYEGPGSALIFVVTLAPTQEGTVTVDYATRDGTAKEDDDYTATSGTLTFDPGEHTKTVSVTVVDDDVPDSGEYMTLVISNATGGPTITDGAATGTIRNIEEEQGQNGGANNPPTGSPTITGTVQVGETLTAHTSGISDADGLTNVSYSYQWIAGDADIAGATASTYTITANEQGKVIKVKVSFTDDADNEESLTSVATAAVSSVPGALTASISNQPDSHDGENSFEFELLFSINPDVSYLTLEQTAFNVAGGTITSASRLQRPSNIRWLIRITPDSTGTVSVTLPASANCDDAGTICTEDGKQLTGDLTLLVPGPGTQHEPTQQEDEPNNPASGSPTITGTATVGKTLTAHTSEISDADGLTNVSYSYQWIAGEANIAGATASTYTLTANEQGKAIKVKVSFTDDTDNEESLTSEATAAVAARPNNAATGAPSISGTVQVGHTLTATLDSIGDQDGINNAVFAYQWLRDGEDIASATGSSYTLLDADEGAAISVRVSFTDDRGNSESLMSQTTAEVAGRPPLTVSVSNAAASHDGSNTFTFELHFSEEFPLSYRVLKFDAFSVSGGSVKKSQRMQKPSNIQWLITVQPSGNGIVIVTLPETTDCSANGAICTADGRKLSHQLKVNVRGRDG